ncbi:MAG: TRAP transporter large permease [Gammaproteobacteria bacterium]|nr:TRAP transporter large permease [Gammaproteobacteria bacterium]MDE0454848.1 TRAP transporter large permease [Gammaproteobacteria bacterium]
MVWLLLLVLVVCLVLSGTEYAYIVGAIAVVLFLVTGHGEHLTIVPQRVFSQLDSFALTALPMFILAGEIMGRGGVTRSLIDFSLSLMGKIRGALGHVNVLTSVFFAGVSGAATADAAALGNTLVPAMRERGYRGDYAASITAASAIIGPIIPPSIILIMYGALMETDIAALFAAGIIPGLMLAAVLIVSNAAFARRKGHPAGEPFDLQHLGDATRSALPALALPIVIVAGIVFGVTTPTEAGALAVVLAIAAARVYGMLSQTLLVDSLRRTVRLVGSIFVLIAASSLISYLAAIMGASDELSTAVAGSGLAGRAYLFSVVASLLVVGMFTGVRLGLFLVVPLIVPEAIALGADPVHTGIVVCLSLALGLITPPFGPVLLVTSAVTGVSYWQLVRGTIAFTSLHVVVLAVLAFLPGVSLWLPKAVGLL